MHVGMEKNDKDFMIEMEKDFYDQPRVNIEKKKIYNICKFHGTKGGCWAGRFCTQLHADEDTVEDDFTEISEKLKIDVTVTEEDDDVIDNLVGKWMIVMVSTMVNPNNFHVVFPYGVTTDVDSIQVEDAALETFFNKLNEHYMHQSINGKEIAYMSIDRDNVRAGKVVVVWCKDHQAWCRARVIEATERCVKVHYMDFGNTEVVPMSRLRPILPFFTKLPEQAYHATIPVESPSVEWSEKSIDYFESQVKEKILLAFVLDRKLNGSLELLLFKTLRQDTGDIITNENNLAINPHSNGVDNEDDICASMVAKGIARYKTNKTNPNVDREIETTEVINKYGDQDLHRYKQSYLEKPREISVHLGGSGYVIRGVLMPG